MGTKLRGVRNIPSATKLIRPTRVRAQCEYDIFNKLAQLSQEKARLDKEKKNWQKRVKWIDVHLSEIEKLEESLQRQIAAKEKITPEVQDSKQTAGKERSEVVIKY